jgi:hypothetical protein
LHAERFAGPDVSANERAGERLRQAMYAHIVGAARCGVFLATGRAGCASTSRRTWAIERVPPLFTRQSASESAKAPHARPVQGKPYGTKIEEATQRTERAATNGKTLSLRLDTESFMEASLPTIQNCFGELSGDGTCVDSAQESGLRNT